MTQQVRHLLVISKLFAWERFLTGNYLLLIKTVILVIKWLA